jgi:hypothetical protein
MLGIILICGRGDKAFSKDCSALEAKRRKRKKITNFSTIFYRSAAEILFLLKYI